MINNRGRYKAGDLVLFFDTRSINPEHYKPRPAFVLGFDKVKQKINLLPITTKRGRTEEEGYLIKGEEIKVPKGLYHVKNGKNIELQGVIKTNNILQVNREHVTTILDVFPVKCKDEILLKYEHFKEKEWYKRHLEMYSENHEKIYRQYKESLVADRLGFLCIGQENIYDFNKELEVDLKGIQKIGKKEEGNGFLYSVILDAEEEEFEYTILTEKSEKDIVSDWKRLRTARDWLYQDKEYHVLMRDYETILQVNPEPSSTYYTLNRFEKTFTNQREIIF